jgi:hypothetical protein
VTIKRDMNTLAGLTDRTVTVSYTTEDGTAANGADPDAVATITDARRF